MKTIYIYYLLLFLTNQSLNIDYDFNLNLRGINIHREAKLLFNTQNSIFYHSRGEGVVTVDRYGNIGDITMTVTTVNDNSGAATIDFYTKDKEGNVVFIDYKSRELTVREIVFLSPYIYKEPMANIPWMVSDSTKNIGKYSCNLATGEYKGRTYNVWFTTEIPAPIGPWKLGGLPGAILEATDSEHEVEFKVKKITNYIEPSLFRLITKPEIGEHIGFEESKNIYHEVQRKMVRQANSQRDRGSDKMNILRLNTLERY